MEEPFACTTYCRQYCTNSFVTIVAEMITSAKKLICLATKQMMFTVVLFSLKMLFRQSFSTFT